MGILLSILVECVGVLEVIACYQHFTYGLPNENSFATPDDKMLDIKHAFQRELVRHDHEHDEATCATCEEILLERLRRAYAEKIFPRVPQETINKQNGNVRSPSLSNENDSSQIQNETNEKIEEESRKIPELKLLSSDQKVVELEDDSFKIKEYHDPVPETPEEINKLFEFTPKNDENLIPLNQILFFPPPLLPTPESSWMSSTENTSLLRSSHSIPDILEDPEEIQDNFNISNISNNFNSVKNFSPPLSETETFENSEKHASDCFNLENSEIKSSYSENIFQNIENTTSDDQTEVDFEKISDSEKTSSSDNEINTSADISNNLTENTDTTKIERNFDGEEENLDSSEVLEQSEVVRTHEELDEFTIFFKQDEFMTDASEKNSDNTENSEEKEEEEETHFEYRHLENEEIEENDTLESVVENQEELQENQENFEVPGQSEDYDEASEADKAQITAEAVTEFVLSERMYERPRTVMSQLFVSAESGDSGVEEADFWTSNETMEPELSVQFRTDFGTVSPIAEIASVDANIEAINQQEIDANNNQLDESQTRPIAAENEEQSSFNIDETREPNANSHELDRDLSRGSPEVGFHLDQREDDEPSLYSELGSLNLEENMVGITNGRLSTSFLENSPSDELNSNPVVDIILNDAYRSYHNDVGHISNDFSSLVYNFIPIQNNIDTMAVDRMEIPQFDDLVTDDVSELSAFTETDPGSNQEIILIVNDEDPEHLGEVYIDFPELMHNLADGSGTFYRAASPYPPDDVGVGSRNELNIPDSLFETDSNKSDDEECRNQDEIRSRDNRSQEENIISEVNEEISDESVKNLEVEERPSQPTALFEELPNLPAKSVTWAEEQVQCRTFGSTDEESSSDNAEMPQEKILDIVWQHSSSEDFDPNIYPKYPPTSDSSVETLPTINPTEMISSVKTCDSMPIFWNRTISSQSSSMEIPSLEPPCGVEITPAEPEVFTKPSKQRDMLPEFWNRTISSLSSHSSQGSIDVPPSSSINVQQIQPEAIGIQKQITLTTHLRDQLPHMDSSLSEPSFDEPFEFQSKVNIQQTQLNKPEISVSQKKNESNLESLDSLEGIKNISLEKIDENQFPMEDLEIKDENKFSVSLDDKLEEAVANEISSSSEQCLNIALPQPVQIISVDDSESRDSEDLSGSIIPENTPYNDAFLNSLDGIKFSPITRDDGTWRRKNFKKRRSSSSSSKSSSKASRDEELKLLTSLEELEQGVSYDEIQRSYESLDGDLSKSGRHHRKRSPRHDQPIKKSRSAEFLDTESSRKSRSPRNNSEERNLLRISPNETIEEIIEEEEHPKRAEARIKNEEFFDDAESLERVEIEQAHSSYEKRRKLRQLTKVLSFEDATDDQHKEILEKKGETIIQKNREKDEATGDDIDKAKTNEPEIPESRKNDQGDDVQEEDSQGDSDVKNLSTPKEGSSGGAFWLIFSGEYTKAMNKDWHGTHFCCWQCDESLTGQRYVLRDDHPYCVACYESVFANACEECSKTIGIDSKDLSYKDKHWHEACFLCTKCRVSLVDKQFGSKLDKIYCGNCYDAQFASRCDGCGEIFRAGTKKMEYKTRQWHEKCFCCCVCKTAIGTKSFIPREQEIYCAQCYEEKFATRCVKCNKIITSGGVTYKNEPWHRECFTCSNCSTSLAGQRFTSRDDKPYCAECFGELFAKRCTACSKPITGIGGTRFISFEERHWHNDCFVCASCNTSLVGRGFITDDQDIICPECAKQKIM